MHKWLFTCVISAFAVTSVISFVLNTDMSRRSTLHLLKNNLDDVCQAVYETDSLAIEQTAERWADYFDSFAWYEPTADFNRMLHNIAWGNDIDEFNFVDDKGFIVASTVPDYINFDMSTTDQSSEFLILLRDTTVKTYVQELREVGYDNSVKQRYAASSFKSRKGFVEVGISEEHYVKKIHEMLNGSTRHRRIGENGSIFIFDENYNIISSPTGCDYKMGQELGVTKSLIEGNKQNEIFECNIEGENSYCMYSEQLGYIILAVQPVSEATLSRNTSVLLSSAVVFIVFFLLISIIGYLVRHLVVNNIDKVNDSLSKITEGNLNEEVNVRDTFEFDSLSTDINSTVNKLKVYIHEAETRMDADLALAKAIQLSTLPSEFPAFPEYDEFDVFASMLAAKEVGGDFYDFYLSGDNKVTITIADVAGKGIPAAMFMMRGKTTLKNVITSMKQLDAACTRVNKALCRHNDTNTFFTGWVGTIDINTGVMTFVNAGHNLPVIRKNGGEFKFLECTPGLPFAVFGDFEYTIQTVQLSPGDEIFLYTDGVTEAADVDDKLYGDDRLIDSLNNISISDSSSPEKICKHVLASVRKFAEGAEQSDDITMLCFKYQGPKN